MGVLNSGPAFKEVCPEQSTDIPTAQQVGSGIPIPKVSRLQIFSANEWEEFTEEWLMYHKGQGTYHSVQRASGAGDLGLDLVAFTSASGFADPWDSFQCKHYDHALTPGDVYGEVAKVIYHSYNKTPPFNQAARVPRFHVFVAPRGVGLTLGRLLKDPNRLKAEVKKSWANKCAPALGKVPDADLAGALLVYFDSFDFSIFGYRSGPELVEDHSKTVFHVGRFGGGLPPVGPAATPPTTPAKSESRYLRKLLDAYADHEGKAFATADEIAEVPDLKEHYDRQRVLFYHAETLRNFARDRLPPGTFDSLEDDVYLGVVEVCGDDHESGFRRLQATLRHAATLDTSGNALATVTRIPDKQGICHQLANVDRLSWTQKDD